MLRDRYFDAGQVDAARRSPRSRSSTDRQCSGRPAPCRAATAPTSRRQRSSSRHPATDELAAGAVSGNWRLRRPRRHGAAVSPLAPKTYPELPAIAGVRFATAEAGIKYKNRTDVLLAASSMPGTTVAGVFTRSKCPSAPVDWCRANLAGGKARALLVNSGNANAFTGMKGREADGS